VEKSRVFMLTAESFIGVTGFNTNPLTFFKKNLF
jgi:hypothetical protein